MNDASKAAHFTDFSSRLARLEEDFTTRTGGGGGGGGNSGIEVRVASLEVHVTHMLDDVREIRSDTSDIKKQLGEIKDSIASAKVWAAMLYAGLVLLLALRASKIL